MNPIIVIGGSGFIGRNLCEYFSKKTTVYNCSRSCPSRLFNNEFYIKFDATYCDFETINNLVGEKQVSAVVNLAARSIVKDCAVNPTGAFASQINPTLIALHTLFARGSDHKVILFETDKVYGRQSPADKLTDESAPLLGATPYEFSKVMASQIADFFKSDFEKRIVRLRPVNVFGPFERNWSRIVPRTINNIIRGEAPIIYDDVGTFQRGYIFSRDIAKATDLLINKDTESDVYNISPDNLISVKEIIDLISELMIDYSPSKPITLAKKVEYDEIPVQRIDGSRFAREFKFGFSSIEEALKTTITYYTDGI